ncbi:MAG: cobalamin B12-binding domain-containing protein [Elusimicrobia bacterium]|nr:cobalamin B12-binding domain-containing protein [Elusimicrobiota bacterium]
MIILYNPQSSAARKPILPMSLLALAAQLEGRRPCRIIDGNLDDHPVDSIARIIGENSAGVLGVTVMPGPQLLAATRDCRAIKNRFPHVTIVWGGYFPTQHPRPCLNAPYVDFALQGHADFALHAFLEMLEGRMRPSEVPGLVYRDPSGGSVRQVPAGPVPHPAHLPPFPYHRVPMQRYIRNTYLGSRTLPDHTSYGCPFFCNFCGVVKLANGRWLAQSAERIAGNVAMMMRRWNVNAVEFFDNNFFVQEARVAEFADRIKKFGIGWWGEGRIDTMLQFDDRTWRAMAESGLRMVFLGAESGSDETLKRMKKQGTACAAKTLAMAQKCAQWGIIPEFSFMLGNPPDPEKDAQATTAFIRKLKKINPQAEIILYHYTPVPLQGELYEAAQGRGFRFPERLEEWVRPEWQRVAAHRPESMPWFSSNLTSRIRNFEKVLNAYYPTATDIKLGKLHRLFLRGLSAWRYRLHFYRLPWELRAANRLLKYQRPETSGF